MRKLIIPVLLIVGMLSLTNCYYDNEEALYGEAQCSTDSVTFSGTILPIIQNNCISCHSQAVNSGGVTLETFAQVRVQANNGNLLGVITHSSGFPPMPKNSPKLSECNIDAIRRWIESGTVNN